MAETRFVEVYRAENSIDAHLMKSARRCWNIRASHRGGNGVHAAKPVVGVP